MDRAKANAISADVEQAIAHLGMRHGIEIKVGRGSFTGTSYTLKIESADISASGEVQSKEHVAFKRYADRYGLQASDLGRSFEYDGRHYTIIGLNTRAPKRPIQTKTRSGKVYVWGSDFIARKMNAIESASFA
jgi:hypothetical protein